MNHTGQADGVGHIAEESDSNSLAKAVMGAVIQSERLTLSRMDRVKGNSS